MALAFKKIEAFKFGDLEVSSNMTRELELRVRQLKISEDNIDEAREILSSCFGDKAAQVKDFMAKNLFVLDLTRIQVYLTQGVSGLESFNKRIDRYMDKKMDKNAEGASE